MVNLISNSLKFTFKGFIRVSIECLTKQGEDYTTLINSKDFEDLVKDEDKPKIKIDKLKVLV